MNKNLLKEISSMKKMMGLISEQGQESDMAQEYRTRNGIKLDAIRNEDDLNKFITLRNEIRFNKAYQALTGLEQPSDEILERFKVITSDFLKFLAMKCDDENTCTNGLEQLFGVYARNKKPLFDESSIEIKYPKEFTKEILNTHLKPFFRA